MKKKNAIRLSAAATAITMTMAVSGQALAAVLGDINGDNTVSISDVVMLTKYLTAGEALAHRSACRSERRRRSECGGPHTAQACDPRRRSRTAERSGNT